jgi:hypothetical protein
MWEVERRKMRQTRYTQKTLGIGMNKGIFLLFTLLLTFPFVGCEAVSGLFATKIVAADVAVCEYEGKIFSNIERFRQANLFCHKDEDCVLVKGFCGAEGPTLDRMSLRSVSVPGTCGFITVAGGRTSSEIFEAMYGKQRDACCYEAQNNDDLLAPESTCNPDRLQATCVQRQCMIVER